MNFLAHIFLSGDNDHIKIGNLMADGIRGKDFETYPEDIRKGILLHREIDTFTDAHPVFRESTKKLHTTYHHYAGVIVDVFYDHFLSKNWAYYCEEKLEDFVSRFYQSLHHNYTILNDKTQQMMVPMIRHNWLVMYRTVEGIEEIMRQMDYRTGNKSGMKHSGTELRLYYDAFEADFTSFFKDLQQHCHQKLQEL